MYVYVHKKDWHNYLYSASTWFSGLSCSMASSKYSSTLGKKSLSGAAQASRLSGHTFQRRVRFGLPIRNFPLEVAVEI